MEWEFSKSTVEETPATVSAVHPNHNATGGTPSLQIFLASTDQTEPLLSTPDSAMNSQIRTRAVPALSRNKHEHNVQVVNYCPPVPSASVVLNTVCNAVGNLSPEQGSESQGRSLNNITQEPGSSRTSDVSLTSLNSVEVEGDGNGNARLTCAEDSSGEPTSDVSCRELILSAETHDTSVRNQLQNPRLGSILEHIERIGTIIAVSPVERSIIIKNRSDVMMVANLACIDSNFNLTFAKKSVQEISTVTESYSDSVSSDQIGHSQCGIPPNIGRGISVQYRNTTHSKYGETRPSSDISDSRLSVNDSENNRVLSINNTGSLSVPVEKFSHVPAVAGTPGSPPSLVCSAATFTKASLVQFVKQTDHLKADVQNLLPMNVPESQKNSSLVAMEDDVSSNHTQRSNYVKPGEIKSTCLANSNEGSHFKAEPHQSYDDAVLVDEHRDVPGSTCFVVSVEAPLDSRFENCSRDQPTPNTSNSSSTLGLHSYTKKAPLSLSTSLSATSNNGQEISPSNFTNTPSVSNGRSKNVANETCTSKQLSSINYPSVKFSVPLCKPVLSKASGRASKPSVLHSSSQGKTHSDIPGSVPVRPPEGSKHLPSSCGRNFIHRGTADTSKQNQGKLSFQPTASTGLFTPSTRDGLKLKHAKHNSFSDCCDFSKKAKMAESSQDCNKLAEGGRFCDASVATPTRDRTEATLKYIGGLQHGLFDTDNKMEASVFVKAAAADHSCTAAAASATAAKSPASSNLTRAENSTPMMKQDNLQKNGQELQQSESPTCVSGTSLDKLHAHTSLGSLESSGVSSDEGISSLSSSSSLSSIVSSAASTPTTVTSSSSSSPATVSSQAHPGDGDTGRRLRNRNQR